MPNILIVPGRKYEKWTILRPTGDGKYMCKCDCGTKKEVQISTILSGRSKSCGCRKGPILSAQCKKHGMSKHPIYRSWNAMMYRCTNIKCDDYPNYGGRGIDVCERWQIFENFYEDMFDSWFKGGSIERINVNGNYEPSNCKWIEKRLQPRNLRRSVRFNYQGNMMTLGEIAEVTGIAQGTLRARILNRGWTVEQATSIPIGEPKDIKKYVVDGQSLTIPNISALYSIDVDLLRVRINHLGWPLHEAINPLSTYRNKRGNDPQARRQRPPGG